MGLVPRRSLIRSVWMLACCRSQGVPRMLPTRSRRSRIAYRRLGGATGMRSTRAATRCDLTKPRRKRARPLRKVVRPDVMQHVERQNYTWSGEHPSGLALREERKAVPPKPVRRPESLGEQHVTAETWHAADAVPADLSDRYVPACSVRSCVSRARATGFRAQDRASRVAKARSSSGIQTAACT